MAFHLIIPGEMNGRGNSGFWGRILLGAAIAATVVWLQQLSFWLAVVIGPVAVLALLFPWLSWRVAAARRQNSPEDSPRA
jgi:Flp pilus assembly protein TadB